MEKRSEEKAKNGRKHLPDVNADSITPSEAHSIPRVGETISIYSQILGVALEHSRILYLEKNCMERTYSSFHNCKIQNLNSYCGNDHQLWKYKN
jgi:hypothetical protein